MLEGKKIEGWVSSMMFERSANHSL